MKLASRGALVWRLYAVGIVQLGMVVCAVILIGMFVVRRPDPFELEHVSARLEPLLSRPTALEQELEKYRKRDILLSIYDAQEHLVATNIRPALLLPKLGAPLEVGDPRLLRGAEYHGDGRAHSPFARFGFMGVRPARPRGEAFGRSPEHMPPFFTYTQLRVGGKDGWLVARLEPHRPSALPPVLTLLAGLLVVIVGAALTGRWIARPLEQLSSVARTLGGGDFAARADVQRADEMGDVGRAFNEMAGRIQALLLAEKELLANVAHELRTPLARIRVALEIASESDAETVRGSLAEIAVDLAELETLIDDVLTATRFEMGAGKASRAEFALHIEEVAPNVIAERALERFRARHAKRPITLECSEPLPLVEVDPVLFRRVLDNLLENADKYSPEQDQAIRMGVTAAHSGVTFEVVDHGSGIPDEDLPRIFSPFFRGERSRSRDTGGVGLGLTLAKRIVEAHGGTISLTSQQGSGTVVRAWLPLPTHAASVAREPGSAERARPS
jgi:two-component system OmpR family sensor kinase